MEVSVARGALFAWTAGAYAFRHDYREAMMGLGAWLIAATIWNSRSGPDNG